MKRKNSMTKFEAWFLLIGGVIMGSVFIFLMQYAHAPITQEEAIHTTAVFSSYKEERRKGSTRGIILRFEDRDQLSIDGSCVNAELLSSIDDIASGTEVELMVHPNSDTILDLRVGDRVLLEFETASEKIEKETMGFTGLGLVCYGLAACGLFHLVFRRKYT